MASYDSLTDDQKAQVQAFMDVYRPLLGNIARMFTKIQQMDDAWTGGISAILDILDTGTVLQTTTGLNGAAPLVVDAVKGTIADLEAALAGFNTLANRQAYIRAAGLQNTI